VTAAEAQVAAEIIALERVPCRGSLPFFMMPAGKLRERIAIISLGVNRRATVGSQMREEFLDPVVDRSAEGLGAPASRRRAEMKLEASEQLSLIHK
jgi:hypothetical protein